MTTIGNIILVIATLIYFALLTLLLGKPPSGSNDLLGYAWGVILLNLVFLVCMCLVTIIIAYKGGFNWISPNKSTRYLAVTTGLLASIITAGLSSFYKYENGPVPPLLRIFSHFVPILIPLILIAGATVLLSDKLRITVPVHFYRWPLLLISTLGIIGLSAALIGLIQDSSRNQALLQESRIKQYDENNQRMINEIDSIDVIKNMGQILIFTDFNKDPEVKDRALAKVKTNPQWQQELVRLLESDWAPEVFTFLASQAVDSTMMFSEPIKKGILIQARLIRENIRRCSHPSHFYPDQFSWEVERVLRTLEQFETNDNKYLPAVLELRAALDEPSEFKKISFRCLPYLDKWIKKHRQ